MDVGAILDIGTHTLLVAAKLCAPIVLTALAVGFAVSLVQSITQIQEVTLSFVPKLIAVGIAITVCGTWMIQTLVQFTQDLFALIPSLLNG